MDDGSDSGKNPDAGFMSQVRALLNASSDSMAVHSLVSLLSEFRALRGCKEQLVKCQSDAAIRERQYDDALNTIAALEARVAKGETNPLNTKVLRLKRGPMDQEKVLTSDASTQSSTEANEVALTVEIGRLNQEISSWKKRRDTLKAVFTRQTEQFIDDCMQLLGYRVEFLADKHEYRLRSIFAAADSNDEEECLLFRRARDNSMQVIETEFIKSLSPKTMDLLLKSSSIPVFLSQITLDLWRSTIRYSS